MRKSEESFHTETESSAEAELDAKIRKIVREEIDRLLVHGKTDAIVRQVFHQIQAEQAIDKEFIVQETRDRAQLRYLRKTLIRIELLLMTYVNTRFDEGGVRPVIVFPDGRLLGFGFADHVGGDPGGFKLLQFGGYYDFYRLSLERRNYFLEEALRRLRTIVPEMPTDTEVELDEDVDEDTDDDSDMDDVTEGEDDTGEVLHENMNFVITPPRRQRPRPADLENLPNLQNQYDQVIAMLKELQKTITNPDFMVPIS